MATTRPLANLSRSGRVAQLARALPLQGRCRGFEPLHAHPCLCSVDWEAVTDSCHGEGQEVG